MPRSHGRAGPAPPPVVVKIGGSLFERCEGDAVPPGKALLSLLDRARVPVVIVPGGGAFADAVRSEQPVLGLSDPAAHQMALLAMHQMAHALVDLAPAPGRLVIAASHAEIAQALAGGRIAVWQPMAMVAQDPDISEDWTVTSDTLAAWLASRLGARHLVLAKAAGASPRATAVELSAAGIVDRAFPRIVAGTGFGWSVAGPDDYGRLAVLVGADMQPGQRNGPNDAAAG